MDLNAGYKEGHLVTAAIRVLEHTNGRPPTTEEVSKLLGISDEWTGVLVQALGRAGVLRLLKGPFETRLEIKNHTALEKLPREESAAGVDRELQEFSKKKKAEEESLRNLFASGEALRKQEEKIDRIAEGFQKFKDTGPKPSPLFKDPPDED